MPTLPHDYEKRVRRMLDITPEKKPPGFDEENQRRRAKGMEVEPWPPAVPEDVVEFFMEAQGYLKKMANQPNFSKESLALLGFMYDKLKGLGEKGKAPRGQHMKLAKQAAEASGTPFKECARMTDEELHKLIPVTE